MSKFSKILTIAGLFAALALVFSPSSAEARGGHSGGGVHPQSHHSNAKKIIVQPQHVQQLQHVVNKNKFLAQQDLKAKKFISKKVKHLKHKKPKKFKKHHHYLGELDLDDSSDDGEVVELAASPVVDDETDADDAEMDAGSMAAPKGSVSANDDEDDDSDDADDDVAPIKTRKQLVNVAKHDAVKKIQTKVAPKVDSDDADDAEAEAPVKRIIKGSRKLATRTKVAEEVKVDAPTSNELKIEPVTNDSVKIAAINSDEKLAPKSVMVKRTLVSKPAKLRASKSVVVEDNDSSNDNSDPSEAE